MTIALPVLEVGVLPEVRRAMW